MAKVNIQVCGEKHPHRARVIVSRSEYNSICDLDDGAGRDHRLMAI